MKGSSPRINYKPPAHPTRRGEPPPPPPDLTRTTSPEPKRKGKRPAPQSRSKMDAAKKASAGAATGKRRHGSTALFVAVDYAFLLAFAGFLAYLVASRILPTPAA
ncbi:hypothetical protein U9M48_035150 [Paspalum notatum var. saurae]|uniref:Uncharacterized protein n=1 Tax=Paspalum notatum var. saurae TaxID=547442 RepID=A0AAQ3X7L1_PASNO